MFLISDWVGLLSVSGAVLGTFGAGEWLRYRSRWASERTRKLAHIGCGGIVFFFPYIFTSVHSVGVLATAFLTLLLGSRALGFMQSVHGVRRTTVGVFVYPVAIYATALLTWDRPALFQVCVLLLALADGLAALVGKRYGRMKYRLGAQYRTIEGSLTVLIVSMIATTSLLGATGTVEIGPSIVIGLLVGALICAIEALSLWGIDNLLIPVFGAVYLRWAVGASEPTLNWHLGAATVSFAIAIICQRRGYLKLNGAVAAWLVAYTTLGFGGVAWFVPLLGFFLAVNWVGKAAERIAHDRLPKEFERVEEKGSKRDFLQVFANAGVCLVLAVAHAVYPDPILFWAYVGSLSAACADTFASEVGILSRARPVLLWTFRPVAAGLSGGVTVFGYGAAAVGALLPVGILALVGSPYELTPVAFAHALACGLMGSTADSLVGATLQAKRQCTDCRRVLEKAEHCGVETRHYSGLPFVTNDVVNAVGALTGAIAGALLAL